MNEQMQAINELASKYTEQELLQALTQKMGVRLDKDKFKEILDKITNSYTLPNEISQLDIFRGKKALVGDYFKPSFLNTKNVLESLGIEVINEETETRYV